MKYCELRAPGPPGSAAGSRGVSDPALLTRTMNEVPLALGVKQRVRSETVWMPENYAASREAAE